MMRVCCIARGEYEVRLTQYTRFLNAVAATDAYGLDNPGMGTSSPCRGLADPDGGGASLISRSKSLN
jgi:hypothetical protein